VVKTVTLHAGVSNKAEEPVCKKWESKWVKGGAYSEVTHFGKEGWENSRVGKGHI